VRLDAVPRSFQRSKIRLDLRRSLSQRTGIGFFGKIGRRLRLPKILQGSDLVVLRKRQEMLLIVELCDGL